jgi:hypothetical protein
MDPKQAVAATRRSGPVTSEARAALLPALGPVVVILTSVTQARTLERPSTAIYPQPVLFPQLEHV